MPLPQQLPQLKREELLNLIRKRIGEGYLLPEFAIIGIRGYYKRTMGNPARNDRAIYDDAIFLVTDTEFHGFNANCDPSRYKKGIASLKPGVWPCYKFDIHGGKVDQYPAICQRKGKVTIVRDEVGEDTGMFGINIHRGGNIGTSSEGCQTVPPSQWTRFYSTAERLAKNVYGNGFKTETITYILLESE